jgi:hypothetical protein
MAVMTLTVPVPGHPEHRTGTVTPIVRRPQPPRAAFDIESRQSLLPDSERESNGTRRTRAPSSFPR